MSNVSLDHLKRLSPRDAWTNEATDFTPWLAQEENFVVLAEALHFTDAEVEGTEQSVGSFSADIIARDRDGFILVENQLEQTDHTHLGQILTYLAGLDGVLKVVWVSTKVREEHRAAVDWLNAHTPDDFSFFAVELELFQIGTSPAAPHFHVVAKPNEWSRHISNRARSAASTAMNDRQRAYQEYWTAFAKFMADIEPTFATATPPKDHWWGLSIGRSGFQLSLLASSRDHWVGAELYIHNDQEKLIFDHFKDQEGIVHEAFEGEIVDWERLDDRKASRIAVRWRNIDPMDQSQRDKIFPWYKTQMQRFRTCFSQQIKDLDVEALKADMPIEE